MKSLEVGLLKLTLLCLSGKLSRITIWRLIPHLFCIHPNPEMVIKIIEYYNYCLFASQVISRPHSGFIWAINPEKAGVLFTVGTCYGF